MTILEALDDPALFGPAFAPAESWAAWRAFLAAAEGLPLEGDALATYRRHTGRTAPPAAPAREAWVIVGRRGGKSRIAALLTVYAACFRRYTLAPGERGVAMVIAADRRQARVVLRYVAALLEASPMLARLVARRTRETLHLTNGIDVEIHTASFRSIRGYTVVAAVLDELAYWPTDDAAEPDTEILAALRPGMATVPEARLVAISSPYSRRGELWRAYADHYGRGGDPVLVWQAETAAMNPTVDPAILEAAYADDEPRAAAEYGAQFRRDVETFVAREALDACTVPGRRELPPVEGVRHVAFVDPSGGSQDSMTLAVAHAEGEGVVLDLVRERRPPFSPDDVVKDFCRALAAYGCATVEGDRYAGEWPRERFRAHGVAYTPAAKAKSELYAALLPLLNSGRVALLDERRLLAQLAGLERRTARGGRDTIDHGPGAHDDVANAAAGALVAAAEVARAVPFDPRAQFAM